MDVIISPLTELHCAVRSSAFSSLSEKVLRGSLCKLRASVVNVFPGNFTTETQSITEFAERNSFFRQTPEDGSVFSIV